MYMVIDKETAQCNVGFATTDMAEQFKQDLNIKSALVMPCQLVDVVSKDIDMVLYDNTDSQSVYSHVAEYREDLTNEDLIDTKDIPVKFIFA